MLDARFVRDNPEEVINALKNRGYDPGVIDDFLKIEEQRRALLLNVERYRQERNALSEEISRMKKEGADVTEGNRESEEYF